MSLISKIKKGNETLEIWLVEGIINTPALPLVIQCYSELTNKGLGSGDIAIKNHTKVVWVQNSAGKILAGICFDYIQDRLELWISFSFTAPEFRGQGLNAICHSYVEKYAKRIGAQTIGSLVSVDNTNRLQSAKKIGLEPLFYKMVKKL